MRDSVSNAVTSTALAIAACRFISQPTTLRMSPVAERATACAALSGSSSVAWEELGIRLAARALQMDETQPARKTSSAAAITHVTESVRWIEAQQASDVPLVSLARQAGLSPFHYLRTFESVTGTTPHQYILRTRLRTAATRLANEEAKIVDVAFDAGFGDISNFNKAFRGEFGVSPTTYRQRRRD